MTEQTLAPESPAWPTCTTEGCIGIRIEGETACLAHIDEPARQTVLAALRPGARVDLRGTPVSSTLLDRVLAVLQPEGGPATFGAARFDKAHFTGDARFNRARFTGDARFDEAQFNGDAGFDRAWFGDLAGFDKARFTGVAGFDRARFGGLARFDEAHFDGDAWFHRTHFTGSARFNGAQFAETARFVETQFGSLAEFSGARFDTTAEFNGAQFSESAQFNQVQFAGDAHFNKAWFDDSTRTAWFGYARFGKFADFVDTYFATTAVFEGAEFAELAMFAGAQFAGDVRFNEARFDQDAWFGRVRFTRIVMFSRARFSEDAMFSGAWFGGDTWFDAVQFKGTGRLGPLLTATLLDLDRATFDRAVLIEAASPQISCVDAHFADAAILRLRYADIALDGTVFSKPSTISFARDTFKGERLPARANGLGDTELLDEALLRREGRDPVPRLVSLRRVDVSTLALANLNFAACLFVGAHHLDQLRTEGPRAFALSPGAWRLRLGRWQVPIWQRWTRRQVLAEERAWRAQRRAEAASSERYVVKPQWDPPSCQIPRWVAEQTGEDAQLLSADHLASLYRSLRKAKEDAKDEPGAADFYYGEMEMRRLADSTPFTERLILTVYWLLAGYGLRGLRALAWLAGVVLGLAVLFQHLGFTGSHPSLWNSLVYTAQATVSLESKAKPLTQQLTVAGEVLRIILRLAGPILLGLALLSVRNRIKR